MTRKPQYATLAEQINLGPRSAAMLAGAGINSLTALRRMGSVRAYLKVKNSDPSASLNLLWALEGALTNTHWREVAKSSRANLLFQLDDILRGNRPKGGARK